MTRRIRVHVAAVTVVVCSACGVSVDDSPTEVADDDVPFGLLTTPTTPPPPAATVADAAVPITACFHLGSDIVTVTRSAPESGVTAALEALLNGPTNEELAQGLSSTVFDPNVVVSARVSGGIATVELSPAFADAGTSVQLDAIVEIVCTLTAQPGVGQVAFELRGERVEVPRGDGSLTAEPVSRDDFPDLTR